MVPLAAVRNASSDQSETAEKPTSVAAERERMLFMVRFLARRRPDRHGEFVSNAAVESARGAA
jgi:hypothetical protein